MAFITPIVKDGLEWEIAQWVHQQGSIHRPTEPQADTLPWSYILALICKFNVLAYVPVCSNPLYNIN